MDIEHIQPSRISVLKNSILPDFWTATYPDFPDWSATGSTPVEAVTNLENLRRMVRDSASVDIRTLNLPPE
jgi:hypothetical protein